MKKVRVKIQNASDVPWSEKIDSVRSGMNSLEKHEPNLFETSYIDMWSLYYVFNGISYQCWYAGFLTKMRDTMFNYKNWKVFEHWSLWFYPWLDTSIIYLVLFITISFSRAIMKKYLKIKRRFFTLIVKDISIYSVPVNFIRENSITFNLL